MNVTTRLIFRALLAGLIAWVAGSVVNGFLLAGTRLAGPTGAPTWQVVLLALIAMSLIVASLIYPALRSVRRGSTLAVALFLAVVGIHVVLVWLEGLAVNLLPGSVIARAFIGDVIVAAILAFLLARAFDEVPTPQADRPVGGWNAWSWVWRVALCACCYLVLYITAGILIFPAVQPFYAAENLTVNPAVLLPLQIVRGSCYVLFTLPLLRSLAVCRWQASLAMAVMFPVLAGVAALIIPNPIMPGWVRAWHFMEIAWSNFAFGALVGAMFWNAGNRKTQERATSKQAATAAA
jgi:hypothetical protein